MRKISCVVLLLMCFTVSAQVSYEEIQINCSQARDGKYIITTHKEYQALIDNRSSHPNCSGYTFPEIDFTSYTLIGFVAGVKGCYSPLVNIDYSTNGEDCEVDLNISTRGLCKMKNMVVKWLLIPRTPKANIQLEIKIREE